MDLTGQSVGIKVTIYMFIDIDYIELNNVSFDFKMLYCTMQKIFFKLKIISQQLADSRAQF